MSRDEGQMGDLRVTWSRAIFGSRDRAIVGSHGQGRSSGYVVGKSSGHVFKGNLWVPNKYKTSKLNAVNIRINGIPETHTELSV